MSRARDAKDGWMVKMKKKVAKPVKIQKKKIYNLVTSKQMAVVAAHDGRSEWEISWRERITEGRSKWRKKTVPTRARQMQIEVKYERAQKSSDILCVTISNFGVAAFLFFAFARHNKKLATAAPNY